jgi:hypothetical protein
MTAYKITQIMAILTEKWEYTNRLGREPEGSNNTYMYTYKTTDDRDSKTYRRRLDRFVSVTVFNQASPILRFLTHPHQEAGLRKDPDSLPRREFVAFFPRRHYVFEYERK